MTDDERDELRKSQALWYAWGHEDSGTKLAGDAWDFAQQYRERYRAYNAERIGFMESMRSAFEKWQRGERLMADVEAREKEKEKAACLP